MGYNYKDQRMQLFTEQGQVLFLKVRDKARELLATAAAFQSSQVMCFSGITWDMLASLDRLVELGELIEIPNPISGAGQHRIFIGPYT